MFMVVSVDGYFEGPNHDITWHMVDDEFNQFAVEQINEVDTLLFGRVTYELMASFWPKAAEDPNTAKDDLTIAQKMNSLPKIVFSKSLNDVDWDYTRLIKTDVKDEVLKLKNKTGKDIAIFGSNNLAANLINMNLVDEFRIMVNPVALGDGNSVFAGVEDKLFLKPVSSRKFTNGNVLLYYHPIE